jgi:hypothetical protein
MTSRAPASLGWAKLLAIRCIDHRALSGGCGSYSLAEATTVLDLLKLLLGDRGQLVKDLDRLPLSLLLVWHDVSRLRGRLGPEHTGKPSIVLYSGPAVAADVKLVAGLVGCQARRRETAHRAGALLDGLSAPEEGSC